MKRFLFFALLAIVPVLCGCTQLDKEWHEVNQKFREGNVAFAAVAKAYRAAANDQAGKKHALQKKSLDRDWEDFKRIHTNKDGRLVSVDADGQEKPLRAVDLDAAVAAREQKLLDIRASEASWAAVDAPFGESIERFVLMTEQTGETEEKIVKAKASARAFVDSVLTAVGGVAAGFMSGVTFAP